MASFTLRQSSWCLQIRRTSRIFSVSFTTALPRRGRSRRLPSPSPAPLSSFLQAHHRYPTSSSSQTLASSTARRAFSQTNIYRQQQSSAAAGAASQDPPTSPASSSSDSEGLRVHSDDLTQGLNDSNLDQTGQHSKVDWTRSFDGLSQEAFSPEAAKILTAPINVDDIEVKSDGILYLPEIKYRRILNDAFGPGGWGLAPRGETIVTSKAVTREYALVALGRLVSIARGEQDYFSPDAIPTAVEGCKSIALRRCCKDLGIASELWDPRFIRKFIAEHTKEVFVEHMINRKKRKITLRKDDSVQYPWKLTR